MDPSRQYIVRAEAEIELDALPAPGEAVSARDLAAVRALARRDIEPERLFVLPYRISSTDIDFHHTWFDRSSLENFQREGMAGTIPLMEFHEYRRNPTGRVFNSKLERTDEERPDPPGVNRGPVVRMILRRRAYMVRDHVISGEPNEERIKRIDDGTVWATSIGAFATKMTCDICGGDYFNYEACPHFQGSRYEIDGEEKLCTVRISEAVGLEDSLVFSGANPAAEIERDKPFLMARARYLAEHGRLNPKEIERIQGVYRFLVADPKVISLPPAAPRPAGQQPKEHGMTSALAPAVTKLIGDERVAKLGAYATAGGDQTEAVVRMLIAEAEDAESRSKADGALMTAQLAEVRRILGGKDDEPIAEVARRTLALAKVGQEAREAELSRYIAAHTTVHGPEATNPDELRDLTAGWTIQQLTKQTEGLEAVRKQIVPQGRTSAPQVPGEGQTNGQATGTLRGAELASVVGG